jgi:exo-beta-1,3-glucanase (GH17 family)
MIFNLRSRLRYAAIVAFSLTLLWLLLHGASASGEHMKTHRAAERHTVLSTAQATIPLTLSAYSDYYSHFFRDGVGFCNKVGGGGGGRGVNVAYLDPKTGTVVDCRSFDTWGDLEQFSQLSNYLSTTIPAGAIVLVAIADEGGFMAANQADPTTYACLTMRNDPRIESGYIALEAIGSKQIRFVGYWGSWALIAVKGEGALAEDYHNPVYTPPSNYWCRMSGRVATQITATVALPSPPVAPAAVYIAGPALITVGQAALFTASVEPVSATLPLTYVWQMAEQPGITHVGDLQDVFTGAAHATGEQTITITAANAQGSVAAQLSILAMPDDTSTVAPSSAYLPMLARKWFDSGPHFPLAYSPYRAGQAPGMATPSPSEIAQDLDILRRETKLIRTYGSCSELAAIPPLAAERTMQLYQGLAISAMPASNVQELQCYRELMKDKGNLYGAIVGNEVLLRDDLTEEALAGYLLQAKQVGDVDVSTGDTWAEWCNLKSAKPRCPGLERLRADADFVFIHVHPYWEGVPIEHAAAHVVATQIFVSTTYTESEVIIGETGWPTCGNAHGVAAPGVDNQRRFITDLWKWANLYDIGVVYFSAFDEAWKASPGNEVEGCWGMYNADRTPKHENLDWSTPTPQAPAATPNARIDYPPSNWVTTTKSNCGIPVFGQVEHAQPGWQVKVEVFTNNWYVQDKWYSNGLAPIVDGRWAIPEVILAGQGQYNNHKIRATVVNAVGSPVENPTITAEIGGITRANSCSP